MGDGKQIKIWGDNWLPTRNQPKVSSPTIFGQQNSNVEVLINQSTWKWREEVIDHCFNETEAKIIKKTFLWAPIPNVILWYGPSHLMDNTLWTRATSSSLKRIAQANPLNNPHRTPLVAGKNCGRWISLPRSKTLSSAPVEKHSQPKQTYSKEKSQLMQCVIDARRKRRTAHILYFFVLMCKVLGRGSTMALVVNDAREDGNGDFQSCIGERQRPFIAGLHGVDATESQK